MKEFGWIFIGFVLGVALVVSTPSITVVHKSSDQYQTNYEKQTYLLVPCGQTECR